MRKIALLISIVSLSGCAVEHSFTVTPVKEVPKGKTKVVKKYVAMVADGAKRSRNVIEVYDIGATVNADGDLVGKHQLYRVVESSRWVLASHVKSPDIPAPRLPSPVEPERKEKAPSTPNTASQPNMDVSNSNALARQQANPSVDQPSVIPDDITKASPAERQALQDFGNVQTTPAP
jgi:hypothetical protein